MSFEVKKDDLVGNRYLIQQKLGEGGMAIVYKAHDQKKSIDVAIKFLKSTITSSYIEDVIRFKKEVEVVSKFDHPHIIRFYGSGEFQNVPYLITELLEGRSLADLLEEGRKFNIDEVVEIIRQVVDALSYVHSRDIIHKDIKPGNILIVRDQERDIHRFSIKLLDFGLAQMLDLTKIKKKEKEIAGTFGYMSPEATGIIQKPIDERSDLYSVGVVFYNLVTGRRPYESLTVAKLLHEMVATKAIPVRKINPSVPLVIEGMINKLLDKEQEGRYQSAKGFLYDIERYLGGEYEFGIGERDQKIKLIYQTRLIGREEEFTQIKTLINKAMTNEGSICLIGGEPGVGKTRLVKAVKEYVYQQGYETGGVFIEGRCVSQENKIPYQPFKNALDEYIKKVKNFKEPAQEREICRLRELAGELGAILIKFNPNMKELLGEVPELVALDTNTEKEEIRFIITIANFICNLAGETSLAIIFLDDLQWADEGSLRLLEQIAGSIKNFNLLILGTYRDNEIDERHSLFRIKKEAVEKEYGLLDIKVKPLTQEKTNKMVAGILGEREELVNPLSRYLVEKSGGNPFFSIILLRELVEQKIIVWEEGIWRINWEKIDNLRIPENIIEMVLLRLKAIPPDLDNLLQIGAIIGKEFELDLLYDLIEEDKEVIVDNIDTAIDMQLLEYSTIERDKVLFVHDRIKEAFFTKLGEREQRDYHIKIGSLLERRYKGREKEIIFELAHHYIEGGNKDKGLEYAFIAAEKAKADYANKEAIRYYNYVKEILDERKDKSARYLTLLENLGEVYRLIGSFDESIEIFKECTSLIDSQDSFHKAQVLSKLGDTLWAKGEVVNGQDVLEQALNVLKIDFFKGKPGLIFGIIKEFSKQLLHGWFPDIFVSEKYRGTLQDLTIVKLLDKLAHTFYFSNEGKAFYLAIRSLNLSEKIGQCSELSYSYTCSMAIWITLPWFKRASRDIYKSLKIAQDLGDRGREGSVYAYLVWYSYIINRPEQGIEYAEKAIDLLKGIGEYWELGVAYAMKFLNNWITGRLKEGVREAEDFISIAKKTGALQSLGWALYVKGHTLSLIGEIDEAVIRDIRESSRLVEMIGDKATLMASLSALAMAYSRKGDYSGAVETAKEVKKVLIASPVRVVWELTRFPICAQVYLDTIINNPGLSREKRDEYLKEAGWFCKKSLSWGRKFNYCLGWAYQVNGTYNLLIGKKKKAIKTWERGIKFLRDYTKDRYRLGYILTEEAFFLIKDEDFHNREKAQSYLHEAKEIFKEIGAKLDYKRVLKLLGEKDEDAKPNQTSTTTMQARLTSDRGMDTVLTTSRYLSSILDLDELLEKIVDKVIEVTGADRGILMLYPEEEGGELEIKVIKNLEKDEMEKEGFTISQSIIREVEMTKKAIIIEDAIANNEFKEQASVVRYGLRSVLCIPIESRGKLTGIIYLENRLVGGLFKQSDLLILELISGQAGVSIENARLYKQAIIDGLTGIYNRMFFDNYFLKNVEQAKRYKKDLSLMLIDVDNFKSFNDSYSHQAGDMVLKSISGEIIKRIRKSDVAARYGGDEFVIILPETGKEGARIVGESINKAVREHRLLYESSEGRAELDVTVSIGIAELGEGEDRFKLLENADKALYKVKELGRDRVVVWKE
ncbi:MAG: diguanylate cyclase [bacterium]